ncbi:MAG: hypothetical protein A3G32_08895 [Deltaproteobacteria bacterium RIFCSPLOWO2_12_FULL_40_28]|nr:MAG: hypothetical protein A3C45_01595 [Deltaproteobacteria bacterium RIFCSPHIGHO2_02_FULL_40_28]OGQ21018.1 MAG: hypothetical protein A3E27_04260 [Deltaproteobacteria bacterium RIFCSPHIGHO2_12_FULL_40_32]OGQ39419.1 MAG: hypothetical protein A3I69_05620 [Deltaproteobacteria bacterium RIFCSPLOWO2_02_FULL_40_36]OGQ54700.1 MAG: hypothetical protein A3G32_08895 [Deltaproteobacteria bacterium RIFCSPLOWO2_12_FULL_40_28]
MIAVDTSSFVAYLDGEKRPDTDAVEMALQQKLVVFPPVVLTELLSDPKLPLSIKKTFQEIPILPTLEGYWERAGLLRSKILSHGCKARLADTLITQSCLDHDIPLIAHDSDFRHFVQFASLKRLV